LRLRVASLAAAPATAASTPTALTGPARSRLRLLLLFGATALGALASPALLARLSLAPSLVLTALAVPGLLATRGVLASRVVLRPGPPPGGVARGVARALSWSGGAAGTTATPCGGARWSGAAGWSRPSMCPAGGGGPGIVGVPPGARGGPPHRVSHA